MPRHQGEAAEEGHSAQAEARAKVIVPSGNHETAGSAEDGDPSEGVGGDDDRGALTGWWRPCGDNNMVVKTLLRKRLDSMVGTRSIR